MAEAIPAAGTPAAEAILVAVVTRVAEATPAEAIRAVAVILAEVIRMMVKSAGETRKPTKGSNN